MLDDNGVIRDLSAVIDDIAGDVLLPQGLDNLKSIDPTSLPPVKGDPRLGDCVSGIGNFLCIGLNYSDHAAESGMEIPSEPLLFSKVTSAISGPYDDIVIPHGSQKTDWEVELGVVIGQPAKYVALENALSYVAGYCVVVDLSERSYQLEGTGQWIKGKSCDTFAPIGPWLVTPDEVGDPQNLNLWLEVDSHRYQDSNTANMIFSVAHLISYLSGFFTLTTGDIIATGTPPGVGLGQRPKPVFLKAGQRLHLGIDKLGVQNHQIFQEPPPN